MGPALFASPDRDCTQPSPHPLGSAGPAGPWEANFASSPAGLPTLQKALVWTLDVPGFHGQGTPRPTDTPLIYCAPIRPQEPQGQRLLSTAQVPWMPAPARHEASRQPGGLSMVQSHGPMDGKPSAEDMGVVLWNAPSEMLVSRRGGGCPSPGQPCMGVCWTWGWPCSRLSGSALRGFHPGSAL